MITYLIPVTFQVGGVVAVEADSIDDAIQLARDGKGEPVQNSFSFDEVTDYWSVFDDYELTIALNEGKQL